MAMGETGMHEMAEMEMDLPDNTLPMMTGTGPFGPIGMGGMFTTVKVRKDQPPASHPGGHKDPGWHRHPKGTLARLIGEGETLPDATRAPASPHTGHAPLVGGEVELTVRKPGHHGHMDHGQH